MLSSIFSVRGYLVIGVGVGFIVFMMTLLFGPDIANWAITLRSDSALAGQAGLGRLAANPIIYIAENGAAGAAFAAALWPLILLWILLIIFLFLVIVGSDATGSATSAMLGMFT